MRQTVGGNQPIGARPHIKEIKRVIGNNEIIGVVKADAYGHGSVRCAKVLRDNGVKRFAVATIEEALEYARLVLTRAYLFSV